MNPRFLRNCSHSKNRMYIPFCGKHQDNASIANKANALVLMFFNILFIIIKY